MTPCGVQIKLVTFYAAHYRITVRQVRRMRLLIITIVLFFSFNNTTAQAAEWVEVYHDIYMDASNHKYDPETKMARVWLKAINTERYKIKDIKGEKVLYLMVYEEFDCARKQSQTISMVSYGLQLNILDSYKNPDPTLNSWWTVIPNWVGKRLYTAACHQYLEGN